MANDASTQDLELMRMIELGHKLLDRLVTFDSSDPSRAWEPVVELEGLVDRLKEMRPPARAELGSKEVRQRLSR